MDAEVREWAVMTLEELGWVEEAADLLIALAHDRVVGAKVRRKAAKALGRLGRATPKVLAGLRALVEKHGTPKNVRRAMREALERLGE